MSPYFMDRDQDVLVFTEDHDGTLIETNDGGKLSCFGGVLPNVGDILALRIPGVGIALDEVVRRYRLNDVGDENEDPRTCWVLIVRSTESEAGDKLDEAIERQHALEQTIRNMRPLAGPLDPAEKLDRSNRDPEYWTLERKKILRKEREARLAEMAKPELPQP